MIELVISFSIRIIDLFRRTGRSGRIWDREEDQYFTKCKPNVYFSEVPKNCVFNFSIETFRGNAFNYIDFTKLEATRGYMPVPEKFLDTGNVSSCKMGRAVKFIIEVRRAGRDDNDFLISCVSYSSQ